MILRPLSFFKGISLFGARRGRRPGACARGGRRDCPGPHVREVLNDFDSAFRRRSTLLRAIALPWNEQYSSAPVGRPPVPSALEGPEGGSRTIQKNGKVYFMWFFFPLKERKRCVFGLRYPPTSSHSHPRVGRLTRLRANTTRTTCRLSRARLLAP